MTTASGYQRGWRRMLVDMEIPDWDERFLTEFDPIAKADLYARAGASAVMFSCKALTGLCFWPTKVGAMHPGLGGRDVVGETAEALRERGIAACAYYSAIYDNWASHNQKDWRIEPILGREGWGPVHARHGLCCPNNPGYREYIREQIADLYGRYDFDCAFCDMTFWPGICGCSHCRDRFRSEAGAEFPTTIDWTSPEWCTFQAARERWIVDFHALVTGAMRKARPGIAVYHNFAVGPMGWKVGVPLSMTEQSDFLGGDLYGDTTEQFVVIKLMNNLSQTRPVEYMTFCTPNPGEHSQLKRLGLMRSQVLRTIGESAAFMFIDAVDPIGTANPGVYDRVREAFDAAVPFEPHLGGEAIEDVAVYFSSESKMDFAENGKPMNDPGLDMGPYPHLQALRGACRILQRAHIPYGVITRKQLPELDRYRVVVLPNVVRMDEEEATAFREYVRRGGRLYASKYTSLVESAGRAHDDFMLSDMFGVHLEREERTGPVFAKPSTATVGRWFEPQKQINADPSPGSLRGGLLRLRAAKGARVLATLTLPYGHPDVGDVRDRKWASIHSFPPWEDTKDPVLVGNRFGSGRVVYCAFDIERDEAEANERLFRRVIEELLGSDWSIRCETDPSVAVAAFRGPDENAIRVSILNSPPALVPKAALRIRPPEGSKFTGLEEVTSGRPVRFQIGRDGTLRATLRRPPELTMVLARYESA